MKPSSNLILTRLIEFLLLESLDSSMQRSESESSFLVCPICVNCSVVVRRRAIGVRNDGNVSNKVGREFVKNGFIYLKKERFKYEIEYHFRGC